MNQFDSSIKITQTEFRTLFSFCVSECRLFTFFFVYLKMYNQKEMYNHLSNPIGIIGLSACQKMFFLPYTKINESDL